MFYNFWIWCQEKHKEKNQNLRRDCCFKRVIGLTRKDKEENPLFNYEKLLYGSLLNPVFLNCYPSIPTMKTKYLFKEFRFRSSKFAIVVTEYVAGKIRVNMQQ